MGSIEDNVGQRDCGRAAGTVGVLLAEFMQHIPNELAAGKTSALSKFMHAETQRVLGDVPALRVPGITRQ